MLPPRIAITIPEILRVRVISDVAETTITAIILTTTPIIIVLHHLAVLELLQAEVHAVRRVRIAAAAAVSDVDVDNH